MIEALPGETFDDADVTRSFAPAEARAFAAALVFAADEAERSIR